MTLQIIGACLIALAVVLMWVSMIKRKDKRKVYLCACVAVLIIVGIIDLVLIDRQEQTISTFIRGILPGWLGVLVMIAVVLHTWSIFGVKGLVPVLIGCILGHLFWSSGGVGQEERTAPPDAAAHSHEPSWALSSLSNNNLTNPIFGTGSGWKPETL